MFHQSDDLHWLSLVLCVINSTVWTIKVSANLFRTMGKKIVDNIYFTEYLLLVVGFYNFDTFMTDWVSRLVGTKSVIILFYTLINI